MVSKIFWTLEVDFQPKIKSGVFFPRMARGLVTKYIEQLGDKNK